MFSRNAVKSTRRREDTVKSVRKFNFYFPRIWKSSMESTKELIYETTNASLHQCDASEHYILHFGGDTVTFRACELITFKRKIQKIDLATLLSSETPDVEIIHMPHCDRIFALSIHNVLELKDLFGGAFTMLELNSVIHRQLVRKIF